MAKKRSHAQKDFHPLVRAEPVPRNAKSRAKKLTSTFGGRKFESGKVEARERMLEAIRAERGPRDRLCSPYGDLRDDKYLHSHARQMRALKRVIEKRGAA